MLIKGSVVALVLGSIALLFPAPNGHLFANEKSVLVGSEPKPEFAPVNPVADTSPFGFVAHQIELDHIIPSVPLLGEGLPARFDWREYGKVTSVKNQSSCGSCYAFAALGNFESKVLLDANVTYDFSENNVKECEWYESSCGGGNYWRVANFLSAYGTVLESCDPYVASDVDCKSSCPYIKVLRDWCVASSSQPASVDAIKGYLQTYGPLYTTMYAGSGDSWYYEFQSYNGSYTLYYDGSQSPNHAVLIVGWDDNLTHEGGQGGWIVKNSWGTSWGGTCGYGSEKGYFTIAYGSAKIGSNIGFVSAWSNYDQASKLIYHDEGGFNSAVGYGNTTAWGLCKFIPTEDMEIRSVEVWLLDAAVVDIYIYDDFSSGVPSGLLASKLGSSFDLPGYHSIDLTSPITVLAGDDIFVVAKITDQTYTYPLAFDGLGTVSLNCYISWSGSYFTSFTSGDLGIRVRGVTTVGCGNSYPEPTILSIQDVPDDAGGYVEIKWIRSVYDQQNSSPRIRKYKIWRRRNDLLGAVLGVTPGTSSAYGQFEHAEDGSVWELVATVTADGSCSYSRFVPTTCDSSAANPCPNYFYVSGVTGIPGQHYNSAIEVGYSVNNGAGSFPVDIEVDSRLASISSFIVSPNPARSQLDLEFDIKEKGWVLAEIYDVLGRRVAILLDGFYSAGLHTASVRMRDIGSNLAPGTYFIKVSGLDRGMTRKVVLMR
ncbi:MAG: C1 family peptidase [bacterium]